jgi:hypothetical protein
VGDAQHQFYGVALTLSLALSLALALSLTLSLSLSLSLTLSLNKGRPVVWRGGDTTGRGSRRTYGGVPPAKFFCFVLLRERLRPHGLKTKY